MSRMTLLLRHCAILPNISGVAYRCVGFKHFSPINWFSQELTPCTISPVRSLESRAFIIFLLRHHLLFQPT